MFCQKSPQFFTQISKHICAYRYFRLTQITLIWISLERSFPPAELEYERCQFWSKVMMTKVEERPKLITVSYGRHRSQWVKGQALASEIKVAKHSFQVPMPNSPLLLNCFCFGTCFLQESRLTTEVFILAFWLGCAVAMAMGLVKNKA